ncbi:MAG: prepilin-type N-terminal cleavage/methylation domain-containing protein [Fimbriimonadaceae bacterium]|nr:prepilin-type N-terminal cleavage/methylation domain-containing protein [Fimbriimonadaceae bacterium]
MRRRRGFTLIELITVMAITAILLTIISIPMIQSFNLTRAAQAFADAQDRARVLIDRVSREIANSAGVRDNTGPRGALDIRIPGQNGAQEIVRIENAKLDIIKPAQGEESIDPNNPGVFTNPNTGLIDPTLHAPKGQVVLPVAAGTTLVRYFIGLKQPFRLLLNGQRTDEPGTYNNGYDGILMARNGQPDNLYVLWRAEAQPYIWVNGVRQVNTDLFEVDPNTNEPIYDDPQFFLPDGTPAKARRVQAWMNRASIVTEFSRYDMIQAIFNKQSRRPIYDGNVPRIFPLVQFTPKRQTSEPPMGMMAVRSGEETTNSAKIGPDVYRTNFGAWTDTFVRAWPGLWPVQFGVNGQVTPTDPNRDIFAGQIRETWRRSDTPGGALNPYVIADRRRPGEEPTLAPGYSLFAFDPTLGDERDIAARRHIFNLSGYRTDVRYGNPYPFTTNLGNTVLSDQALRRLAVLFNLDPKSGELISSFPIEEVGVDAPPAGLADNRPFVGTGPALTPANDNTIGGGQFYTFNTINQRFNRLWNDWDTLLLNSRQDASQPPIDLPRERFCKRFIDLRVTAQADGTPSPMHPTLGFPRTSIVPGSDVVIGPDQNPGPNYGRPVRYQRVTQRPVGPNQYLINYVDQQEPLWADFDATGAGTQGFQLIANGYDPTVYNNQDFVSAVLQPQFRKGYVEFNSRFGEPLPTGNIFVSYRFQFTEPSDTFAIDYDTRQVLDINLTIRNFPQSNLPNGQSITVQGSASVRNFIR